jgi:hypothetical protein
MKRYNIEELQAMKGSSAALNLSYGEVASRLERANDLLTLMLMALTQAESVETLEEIGTDIDRVIEKLTDTKTILRLVVREKELVQKLVKLDKADHGLIHESFVEGDLNIRDLENPNIDEETRARLKQEIEIHNLIDSIQASTENEEIKKKLDRLHGLTGIPRIRHVTTTIREPKLQMPERPYRKLNIDLPTSKGQGYELPKREEE